MKIFNSVGLKRIRNMVVGRTKVGKFTRVAALTTGVLVLRLTPASAFLAVPLNMLSKALVCKRLSKAVGELFTPYERYSTLLDPTLPIQYTGGYYGPSYIPEETLYWNTLKSDDMEYQEFMDKAFPTFWNVKYAAIDPDYEKGLTPEQILKKYGPGGCSDMPGATEMLIEPCYIGLKMLPFKVPESLTKYPIKVLRWLFLPPLLWVGKNIVIPRPVMVSARYSSYVLGKVGVAVDLVLISSDILERFVFPLVIDWEELNDTLKGE